MRAAMAFLTVIPVATHETDEGASGERLGRAYFPAVGALLGLLAGLGFALTAAVTSPVLAGVAAIAVMAVLTGALHIDGLADAADGLFGGGDVARRLEVMRDSRVGSFGLATVVLVLIGDIAALASMSPPRALVALVIAGAVSRWALLLVIATVPYVRQSGLGVAAGGPHRRFDLVLGSAIAAIVCLLDWKRAAAAVLVAVLIAFLVGVMARRRIGGATGDIYGAAAELSQLGVLVVFAARL
ncbi:MAG: cobalamin 5'-phosphate synthase [Chloroflexi bacterium 13_1_40CM_3_65_12]|nr:MAG: cobalamin 5'-phosphate synthase [Chloroflexi bacterium 13_1_40CM_65_17]OLC65975.1 MAG: cobalamin 5'-phosphate synthase [Actinobacteria bacterium 13_1_40CM_4_65_12]OLD26662.1 MAG: cobalamin 5'-phosphate synthase [Chloroflexi bacterium 13_1_40CM_3_65_12]